MIRYVLAAILLAAAIGTIVWWTTGEELPQADHVVLITIDTMRADHLGCYGYPRNTSPFIDRLAGEGVRFERAVAPMATTVPSHAALFTSLYPLQLNVLKNGHRLDADFSTMAELMRARGYETAGFVSTDVHFKAGRLDQGFDHFDEPRPFRKRLGGHFYRDASKTVDAALNWLGSRDLPQRLFVWVHLFDPHAPLRPPGELLDELRADARETRDDLVEFLTATHRVDLRVYDDRPESMLQTIDAYDAETRFADRELERLFDAYEQKRDGRSSLWIVTGDHGEGLGNHGWMGHGKHIYNEQLLIPLIFRFSSGAYAGRVVDRLVENVDVLPTLLQLTAGDAGLIDENVQGESLLPLMAGEPEAYAKRYAFSQRREFSTSHAEHVAKDTIEDEAGEKFAIQSATHKYIYRTAGRNEFFDLSADPYEVDNRVETGSVEEQRLLEALLEKLGALVSMAGAENRSVDAETIEKLKSLGYVQ